MLADAKIFDRKNIGDLLVFLERKQVRDRPALACAAHLGNVVNAPLVHPSLIGKEQQIIVGVGDEEVLDEIAFAAFGAFDSAAAAALRAIGIHRQSLDVSLVADGDDNLFLRD